MLRGIRYASAVSVGSAGVKRFPVIWTMEHWFVTLILGNVVASGVGARS